VVIKCATLNQAFSCPKTLVADPKELLGLRDGVASKPGSTTDTQHDLFREFETVHMVFVWAEREKSSHTVIVVDYAWS
jgi:hypothetical protein